MAAIDRGDSNWSGNSLTSAPTAAAISWSVNGLDPVRSIELAQNLLECSRGRVGADRGTRGPETARASKPKSRTRTVGEAVPLAQVLVQTAQEVASQDPIAQAGSHSSWGRTGRPTDGRRSRPIALHPVYQRDRSRSDRLSSGQRACARDHDSSPSTFLESIRASRARDRAQHRRRRSACPLGTDVLGVERFDVVECQRLDRLGVTISGVGVRMTGAVEQARAERGRRATPRWKALAQDWPARAPARAQSPWGRTEVTPAPR